ncbi:BglG family transcription antiterminator [Staphylococcus pseudoxylosus]|nr:BglG family transcription antiterminator [Staphylococcus pseudoxylosus]
MDKRSTQILKMLIQKPDSTIKTLEYDLGINQRQVVYSIEKINDYLESIYNEKIHRTKNGYFILPENIIESSLGFDERTYILSGQERVEMLLLLLLNREEDISLIHLTSTLHFSKNTIMNILKQAKNLIIDYDIELFYSRLQGYILVGEEYAKRRLLFNIIQKYASTKKGQQLLEKYIYITYKDASFYMEKLEECEQLLGHQFTDTMVSTISYSLVIWEKRIQQNKTIEDTIFDDFPNLIETSEYSVVESVFDNFIEGKELFYLTLQLMVMNIVTPQIISTKKELSFIYKALEKFVENFEKISVITIPDRQKLIEKLYLHMKPAYYRIKYGLNANDTLEIDYDYNLQNLNQLVERSIKPLEKSMAKKIPQSEMYYLTIILGGWLKQYGIDFEKKIIAVVVCPNGLSVSNMIHATLIGYFKDFIFLDPMSIREFINYEKNVDIVFTTRHIETNATQFTVQPVMNEMEIRKLQTEVFESLYGFALSKININNVMEIIDKYAEVINRDKLLESLSDYLFQQNNAIKKQDTKTDNNLSLIDLIGENVNILHSVSDWKEAIRIASAPLLNRNYISGAYVNKVIELCEKDSNYIMLSNRLAIPHAKTEDGVNKLGMSFLKLDNAIEFPNGRKTALICIIAAIDKHKHIPSVLELGALADHEEYINQLKACRDKQELLKVLKNFLDKERYNG